MSKREFEIIYEELFEQTKQHALEIMKFVFKEPHDWMMLNVDSQKMYKNFDEIILPEK